MLIKTMEKHFIDLVDIIKKLRSPDGCPWDREQTLFSLKEHLIEETFELIDAIDKNDIENIKEELGDLLLHVVLHSVIAEESDYFDLNDVIKTISDKLIRRHPHVFGDLRLETSDDVMINWEKIKRDEKKRDSILDGVPEGLPSIQKAVKLQKAAKKVGFDWNTPEECLKKVDEEYAEFKEAIKNNNKDKVEHELGDLVFSLINFARLSNINPDEALRKANNRFAERFRFIENKLSENGLNFSDVDIDTLDEYWEEAKKALG